jgi:hypothetical protein
MHHKQKWTNVLSIQIQESKKIDQSLKQDYLLSCFRPAWFQHLQAQHQQNQDQSTSIQGLDTRKKVLFGKNLCLIKNSNQYVSPVLPSQQLRVDAQS